MGSGATGINSGTKTPPRLCYHALPSQRPEPLGMITPPLQAPGSVPFRWEEVPGKPLSRFSDDPHRPKPAAARCLEPPPGMAVLSSSSSSPWQVAKVADGDVPPKTVLEGPYYVLLRPPASLFDGPSVIARSNSLSCSSFTIGERSLRYYGVGEGGKRRERSAVWFRKRAARRGDEESSMGMIEDGPAAAYNLPRSYSPTATKCYVDDGEGACVEGGRGGGCCVREGGAPPTKNVRITRFRRSGSLPNLSTATTHLWASIYGGLKQVAMAPWRSFRKSAGERWSHDQDH